jgi:hypothetical protein
LLGHEADPRSGRPFHVDDDAGRDGDDGNDQAVVQAGLDVQRKPITCWYVWIRNDCTTEGCIRWRQNCSKQECLGDGPAREDDEVEARAEQHGEGKTDAKESGGQHQCLTKSAERQACCIAEQDDGERHFGEQPDCIEFGSDFDNACGRQCSPGRDEHHGHRDR